jgi:sortase A
MIDVRTLIAPFLFAIALAAPVDELAAQRRSKSVNRSAAACQCGREAKPRRPRFLLPVAGGIGFLPVALAVRDSQPAMLGLPALVDIRDTSPRDAVEGARQLAFGALAPDTATSLPTFMLIALLLTLSGTCLILPRRHRRRAWWNRAERHGRWRIRTVYRRRAGAVVVTGGGFLLLLGSREYAEGAQAQRRARAVWFASIGTTQPGGVANTEVPGPAGSGVLQSANSAVHLPALGANPEAVVRGAPVSRLLIPDIGLDEIVVEGVGPIELNAGPGHFPGSVLPGEEGNAIISAHRDRHFRRMGEVDVGTRIQTETRLGRTEWVVMERRVVLRDTPALFRESEATLTLTTCWPLRYFGPAPDRLIIVAKRVS